MISYKITFEDFAGEEHTETYWFNMSKSETEAFLAKYHGSLAYMIARISEQKDPEAIIAFVMDLLHAAYGKMDDNRVNFRKEEEYWKDWRSSNGFEKFYEEVLGNDEKLGRFIRGVFPKEVQKKMDENSVENEEKLKAIQAADVVIT